MCLAYDLRFDEPDSNQELYCFSHLCSLQAITLTVAQKSEKYGADIWRFPPCFGPKQRLG